MTGILRLPLIHILIAYAIGLFVGHSDLLFLPRGQILLLIFLALWALLTALKRVLWASWAAFSFFFLLGIFLVQSYLQPAFSPSHISGFIGPQRILMEGTIDRSPERTPSGTRLLIKPHQIISGDRHISVEGHLLLFMKGEGRSLRMGDCLRFICRLQRPHGFHNPGVFSYERYLAFERVHAVGFLPDEKRWVKVGEGFKNPILLRIEAWRDHIRNFLERETTLPHSSLFQALVLGEQGKIPEDIREQFIVTGIAHLLAISGDHLGIVAFLVFSSILWLLKRSEIFLLSLPVRKWAAALTIPCLLLYTFIAGGGISVIRATIMVILFLLSIVFDRERHLLYTLALAALLILLFSPPSLFDVSFQLSFLAVLSILYLVPRLLRSLKREGMPIPSEFSWRQRAWKYVVLSFWVTVVAILGTAPFVAFHFNRVSLIGFLANLFAVPWVGFLIVPISLMASLLSFFFYPLASLLISMNQFLAALLLNMVDFFASIPFASIDLSTPTALEIILFYLLLFLAVHLRKGKKIRFLFVGVFILLSADIAYWNLKDLFRKDLTLTFLDVGHGDSILVEFPGGKTMLIDGGGLHEDRFDTGKSAIAPFLRSKKIRKIDTLVLTHPDPDHMKGLNFIASRFSIGRFLDNGARTDAEAYLRLEETLRRRNIERFSLNENAKSQTIGGVEMSILNPPAGVSGALRNQTPTGVNNQSLVMRFRFKNVILLLTGDVEREAEERMVRKGHALRAHILKVPHHGSLSSSSLAFLETAKPECAILSVGERNVGRLPHAEVMERYKRLGTKMFRTDRQGAITVKTDGEKMEIKTFLKGSD